MASQKGLELDYDEKVNKEMGSSWIIIKHIIRNCLRWLQTWKCQKRLKTAAWFKSIRRVKFAQRFALVWMLALRAEVVGLTLGDVSAFEIPFDLEIYTCLPFTCVPWIVMPQIPMQISSYKRPGLARCEGWETFHFGFVSGNLFYAQLCSWSNQKQITFFCTRCQYLSQTCPSTSDCCGLFILQLQHRQEYIGRHDDCGDGTPHAPRHRGCSDADVNIMTEWLKEISQPSDWFGFIYYQKIQGSILNVCRMPLGLLK